MVSVPRKYLFIDDQWIAGTHAIHRSCDRPHKYEGNPIIKADCPWEGGVKLYGTVLREDGRYRMWYQMLNFKEKKELHFVTGVGYAESDDGLQWSKPLKGVRHPRYGKTNVVVASSGRTHLCSPSVIRNDDARNPRDRYQMMFYDAMLGEDLDKLGCPFPTSPTIPGWRGIDGEGMFVCRSKDGIRWERPALPLFSGPNDVASMSRLPDGRLLAAYKTSMREDRHFRIIETAESIDGRAWESHGPALVPDWHDPYGTEFYGMSPFDYFGNLIGLICVYHNSPDDKTLDIQMATSIDGRAWQRAGDRRVLLARGAPGEWDAAGVYVASTPVLEPGNLSSPMRLYYSGINARHDDMRYKEWSIGLATLRQDGFASLDAGHFVGELQTQPVVATGSAIRLNLQCIHGWAKLHVLDAESGKELAVSEKIENLDNPSYHVTWRKAKPFAGRTVRLFIQMQNARLYSFWFEPSKRPAEKGK